MAQAIYMNVQQKPYKLTPTYTVYKSGSTYYAMDEDGTVTTNANFSTLINGLFADNTSFYVKRGSYTVTSSVYINAFDNVNIVLDNAAVLTLGNAVNTPMIFFNACDNCTISGGKLSGNKANQTLLGAYGAQGLLFYQCTNCDASNMWIDDVRVFGFITWGTGTINCGIRNSKSTNCGWNAIQLGDPAAATETACYALNNEASNCSDVGIACIGGKGHMVRGNYVHDMDGNTGFSDAKWGIAVELTGHCTITENMIYNCEQGIETTSGADFNTISNNYIDYVKVVGIVVNSDDNVIMGNRITRWDYENTVKIAIDLHGNNNLAMGNTLVGTVTNTKGIRAYDGVYNKIIGNDVQCQFNGIEAEQNADGTIIQGNSVIGTGTFGIKVVATADNVLVLGNNTMGISAGAGITTAASNTVIKDNKGYTSENSGSSTGNGSQQTIAHGCGFTPTYDQVFLSERSTGLAIPYQSAAPDATNIYVTAVNAKTYNWRVSYSA